MTMIEKVAIALHERDQATEQPYRIPWDACAARYQDELRGDARAALEAMREPTYAMTIDGHTALDETDHTQTKALGSLMGRLAFVDVWQAMIDAALAET